MVIAGGRPAVRPDLLHRGASTEPAMVIAGGAFGGARAIVRYVWLQRSRRW